MDWKSCPCVLSEANSWTGTANVGRWHNQFNWSHLSVPDPCDMVEVVVSNIPIMVEEDRTAECYSLTISQGITFIMDNGSVLVVQCVDK